jgi:hypothetical protein
MFLQGNFRNKIFSRKLHSSEVLAKVDILIFAKSAIIFAKSCDNFCEMAKLKNFVLLFFLAYKDMKDFGSAFQSLLDAFPLLAYQVKYTSTLIINPQFF